MKSSAFMKCSRITGELFPFFLFAFFFFSFFLFKCLHYIAITAAGCKCSVSLMKAIMVMSDTTADKYGKQK